MQKSFWANFFSASTSNCSWTGILNLKMTSQVFCHSANASGQDKLKIWAVLLFRSQFESVFFGGCVTKNNNWTFSLLSTHYLTVELLSFGLLL
jgi:hypothetical protein